MLEQSAQAPQPRNTFDFVHAYLLINGGVAAGRGHPHLLVEAIADWVRRVDAGVGVTSQDGPVSREGDKKINKSVLRPFLEYTEVYLCSDKNTTDSPLFRLVNTDTHTHT